MAQEGHALGGLRGGLRGLNKRNFGGSRMVIRWLYKYVKYSRFMVSGMMIIRPYFAFMDAVVSIKHNAL